MKKAIYLLLFLCLAPSVQAKILIIYTGGTIGSIEGSHGLRPASTDEFHYTIMPMVPGVTTTGITYNYTSTQEKTIEYDIVGFNPTLDSSNMTPKDWLNIMNKINENLSGGYNGYLILHGTDTMSWTASALSYMYADPGFGPPYINFTNQIDKPIVISGSQYPISYLNEGKVTDGPNNLVRAAVIADTPSELSEVVMVFDNRIMRGNRTMKADSVAMDAFHSPNLKDLGEFIHHNDPAAMTAYLTDNRFNTHKDLPSKYATPISAGTGTTALSQPTGQGLAIAKAAEMGKFLDDFSSIALTQFPGIQNTPVVKQISGDYSLKGVVLLTYGTGNGPSTPSYLADLGALHNRGVVIVDTTMVLAGGVNIGHYATGSGLAQAGVISGYDLTPAAAYAKHVIMNSIWCEGNNCDSGTGTTHNIQLMEEMMQISVSGDLTVPAPAVIHQAPHGLWHNSTSNSVTVGWSDVSTSVSYYYLERYDFSISNWRTVAYMDASSREVTEWNLASGTGYFYRVSSYGVNASGQWSTQSSPYIYISTK